MPSRKKIIVENNILMRVGCEIDNLIDTGLGSEDMAYIKE